MMDAVISDAGPVDTAAIATLYGQLFSPPWSAREVEDLIAHPGASAFVVRRPHEADIAGYILGRVAADEAEVLSIGVDPRWRRLGVGRKLIHILAERSRAMGAKQIFLEVSAVNAPAVALYRALGFMQRGVRRGYYQLPGKPAEDALLFALDLSINPRVD